jgi:hypothetical protein
VFLEEEAVDQPVAWKKKVGWKLEMQEVEAELSWDWYCPGKAVFGLRTG